MTDRISEFFYYMNERESIRLRKEAGEPFPWTDDVALQTYRFTNVKREHDKTTRFFNTYFYNKYRDAPPEQILLNCAIFRYFGTIFFAGSIGWQTDFQPAFLLKTAKDLIASGKSIFTGAYVITNLGIKAPKEDVVIKNFIHSFYYKIPEIVKVIEDTNSWEAACRKTMEAQGFRGTGFMAKEVLQDVMLTPLLGNCIDKYTWSPAGPGARKGLNMIVGREPKQSIKEDKALEEMRYLFSIKDEYLMDHVKDLDLTVSDIQWSLCEVSKMFTIRGGGRGKRKYRP